VSKDIYTTVYTREGKQELTYDEWWSFDDLKLYREGDLPAIETVRGTRIWFKNGKRHRETGPAIVWANGPEYRYLAGRHYSEENFYKKLREVDELPLSLALTHEEAWVRERAKNRNNKE
jgi:hypothetical protein